MGDWEGEEAGQRGCKGTHIAITAAAAAAGVVIMLSLVRIIIVNSIIPATIVLVAVTVPVLFIAQDQEVTIGYRAGHPHTLVPSFLRRPLLPMEPVQYNSKKEN